MGANPSVRYHIDLDKNEAWAKNELFPDQRIDLDKETIEDSKFIFSRDRVELLEEILRDRYREKYCE